jgi:hypothetical protein
MWSRWSAAWPKPYPVVNVAKSVNQVKQESMLLARGPVLFQFFEKVGGRLEGASMAQPGKTHSNFKNEFKSLRACQI